VIRAVILDVDGTLVRSVRCSEAALIALFAEHGVAIESIDFTPFIGACEKLAIESIAGENGLDLDLDEAVARKNRHYADLAAEMIEVTPGVGRFLDLCRGRGLKLALASSASARRLEVNLGVLGLRREKFASVLSGEDVQERKPAPDLFLASARNMDVDPSECLVVEDAVSGIEAARAAGCRCLALTTSFDAEKLAAADWIAPTLAEAPEAALDW